jgi:hypothetical protein
MPTHSLDPLRCLVVGVHQPLTNVWLEELANVERDIPSRLEVSSNLMSKWKSYWGTNALYMPSSVVVRRYSVNIS